MAHAYPKTIELATPKASLTPCILDQDLEQLRRLTEVIRGMGYEAIATADPEEALGLVRSGRCRLVFGGCACAGEGRLRVSRPRAAKRSGSPFYRLSSIQLRIPSLTERLEDIPLLVQFFLKKYNEAYGKNISGLTRRAQIVLLQHAWPGNVRELENVISTGAITATGDFIDLPDLPQHLQHRGSRTSDGEEWQPLSLEEVRKVHRRLTCALFSALPRRRK